MALKNRSHSRLFLLHSCLLLVCFSHPTILSPLGKLTLVVFCKGSLCVYCYLFRRYPAVHVFFIDHRNDIVVNAFGLAMSIIGSRVVWYVDPIGAILIGLLILVSWAANAFDHIWLLVGKSAPQEFISKLIYLVLTHDSRIRKVDTVFMLCYCTGWQLLILESVAHIMPDKNITLRWILSWMKTCR